MVPTVPAAYLLELSDAVCDELVLRAEQDPQDAGLKANGWTPLILEI